MGRSPNDDRSDVKNPNNAAYHHDRANRGLDDDDDWAPSAPRISRAEARLLDILQSRRRADRALEAARQRYHASLGPLHDAREAFVTEAARWGSQRAGDEARRRAEDLWDTAALARDTGADPAEPSLLGLEASPDDPDWARAVTAEGRAFEAVATARSSGDAAADAAGARGEAARLELVAFERRTARLRAWEDHHHDVWARLTEELGAAEDAAEQATLDAERTLQAAWVSYSAARSAFCDRAAVEAIPSVRAAYAVAVRAWSAAQEAAAPALRAWEEAQAAWAAEHEACGQRLQALRGR